MERGSLAASTAMGASRPIRALQIITSLNTGGAEVMLRKLLSTVDRSMILPMVISLTSSFPIGDEIESMGIPVVALGGRGGMLSVAQIRRLFQIAAEFRPDVIHSWMYHANVAAFSLRWLPRNRDAALITSVRGALNAPDRQKRSLRLVRRLDALVSQRADAVVFNSSVSAAQHIALGYDSRHVEIIPNGFETTRFKPCIPTRSRMRAALGCEGSVLVGIIGRYDPLKGHESFLQAAAKVAAQRQNCHFVIAGRGCDASNESLTGAVTRLNLAGKVSLLGERSDIADLDCALDVIVSASLSESFPNAIGEAMSCAVPAVVTDVGDCRELVGDTGVVVPPRDATALAAGILHVLNLDFAACAELGARARRRIEQNFALTAVAARFQGLYGRAVSARRERHS